jgi:hypothetical protein
MCGDVSLVVGIDGDLGALEEGVDVGFAGEGTHSLHGWDTGTNPVEYNVFGSARGHVILLVNSDHFDNSPLDFALVQATWSVTVAAVTLLRSTQPIT